MREKRRKAEWDHNGGEDVKDRDRDRDSKRQRRDDDYKEERDRERERERKVSRRREDRVENDAVKKVAESVADKKETRTREEDMAEEQRKLIMKWIKGGDEFRSGRKNEEKRNLKKKMQTVKLLNGDAMDEDEIDPLDAFMNTMVIPEVTKLTTEVSVLDEKSSDDKVKENGRKKTAGRSLDRIIPGEDSGLEYPNLDNDEDPLEDEDDDVLVSGSFGLPPTPASPVTKTAANES
nr:DEAD-box ATP-dependent RNA helicase 42 [Tanacetum cinerariifolium]